MMNTLIHLHYLKGMRRYSMTDDFDDELDSSSGLQLWLSDLSTDSATRNLGAVLIGIGGLLGLIIGIMLISGNVSDILSGQLEESGGTADVEGMVISELVSNSSGAEGVSDIEVLLYDEDGLVIGSDSTDSGGRFSIEDVLRRPVKLEVAHPGNVTVHVLLIPGDYSQITITLMEGEGTQVLDMEGESYLGESVMIATIFAVFTLLTGFAGIAGGFEARKGISYRKTWWLSFLGLWSGALIFVGPLFTLSGMGLVGLSRGQFYDVHSKED